MKSVVIGVLALQGDFSRHADMLCSCDIEAREVRKPEELQSCDGLIIPGGESTVMLRQLDFIHMTDLLYDFGRKKPIFGTCAGLIVLSRQVQGSGMNTLRLLDVEVERNAFGRQSESFAAPIELHLTSKLSEPFRAFFIRAPRIRATGPRVEVLASHEGEPVLVRQGNLLGASFHPEIAGDPVIHKYFAGIVQDAL